MKPVGFEISDKAAKYHGISHVSASASGVCLREALLEFLSDVIPLHEKGGRVIIHHLEFDAGIISRELDRAGLHSYQTAWHDVASSGLCTMDPMIGKWVRELLGMEMAPYPSGNTMKLDDMLKLLPESDALRGCRHSAGADAQLHMRVYRALKRLTIPT